MSAAAAPADSGRTIHESSAGDVSVTSAVSAERRVLTTAKRYLGTRYRLGGTKPGAFDCSGFVRYVFAKQGIELPRTAREQSAVGSAVAVGADSLRVGDLLFFRTSRGRAGHVAMYMGDGRIIHASAGSHRVRFDDLSSPRGRWFIERLTGVRRVLLLTSDRSAATLLSELDKRPASSIPLAHAATIQ
ncbi:MAG TPA: C40 family peptidase [Gemmatimonadaceae bacterium]|nr:C40 family peptidase [Gemmatimonadaceae bacterium]